VESHINKGLAYQLRAMREARGWSQEEVAHLVNMPQTAISRLESPSYGKPTITTLKRMAKVYDVGLVVQFVPFSKLVNWVSGTPYVEGGLSSDAMAVPSFNDECANGIVSAQWQPALMLQFNTVPNAQLINQFVNDFDFFGAVQEVPAGEGLSVISGGAGLASFGREMSLNSGQTFQGNVWNTSYQDVPVPLPPLPDRTFSQISSRMIGDRLYA